MKFEGRVEGNQFYGLPFDATITDRFNSPRSQLVNGTFYFWSHAGVDLAAAAGTPILAPASCVVTGVFEDDGIVEPGESTSYGNYVTVDYEDGTSGLFAHMRDYPPVEIGNELRRGGLLGHVGSTGKSTGPHCHVEWSDNGVFGPTFFHANSEVKDYLTNLEQNIATNMSPPFDWRKIVTAAAITEGGGSWPGFSVESLRRKGDNRLSWVVTVGEQWYTDGGNN